MKKVFALLLVAIFFIACKKDAVVPPKELPLPDAIDTSSFIEIDFANIVNGLPLSLQTSTYVSSANDTFSVDMFKYYISNVQLVTASGYTYTEVESYYLIDQSAPNSLSILIKKVPSNHYTSINFTIGVDSIRNVSGSQTGALDPLNDMFWTWNSGYIMAKIEGHSPQSTNVNKDIKFHIGGFSGSNSGVRKVSLTFPNTANVTKNHVPVVQLSADVYKWFAQPNFTNFSTENNITSVSLSSKKIADNYATMFNVVSVVN